MKNLLKTGIIIVFLLIAFHSKGQINWEYIGPSSISIYSVEGTGPYLFAGAACNEGGVFRSTDYGDHWIQANNGLPGDASNVVSIAASDSLVLAAVSARALYKSPDLADNWSLLSQGYLFRASEIEFAGDPWNIIMAAGNGADDMQKIIKSTNAKDWIDISNGIVHGGNIYALMAKDTIFYAGTIAGVFKLNLHANQWIASNTGMASAYIYALGQNESFLFAGSRFDGIFRSADGINWNKVNAGLETDNTIFKSFAFYGGSLFVAASGDHGGVFQSMDQGDHWFSINTGFLSDVDINALFIQGPYIFAATDHQGVYRRSLAALTSTDETGKNDFNEKSISVYPNPANGKFRISFDPSVIMNGAGKKIEIRCYTMSGEIIVDNKYILQNDESKIDLDFSSIVNGLYIIQIHNQGKVLYRKLAISH